MWHSQKLFINLAFKIICPQNKNKTIKKISHVHFVLYFFEVFILLKVMVQIVLSKTQGVLHIIIVLKLAKTVGNLKK